MQKKITYLVPKRFLFYSTQLIFVFRHPPTLFVAAVGKKKNKILCIVEYVLHMIFHMISTYFLYGNLYEVRSYPIDDRKILVNIF